MKTYSIDGNDYITCVDILRVNPINFKLEDDYLHREFYSYRSVSPVLYFNDNPDVVSDKNEIYDFISEMEIYGPFSVSTSNAKINGKKLIVDAIFHRSTECLVFSLHTKSEKVYNGFYKNLVVNIVNKREEQVRNGIFHQSKRRSL